MEKIIALVFITIIQMATLLGFFFFGYGLWPTSFFGFVGFIFLQAFLVSLVNVISKKN